MNTKNQGRLMAAFRHPKDINEPLTSAEITGMTFASTSLSVLQVVINVFITYYYTNVVGISMTLVGTLLLITRVADGFSDLGMGVIINNTRHKSGKARPWAIRMAVPLLISVVLAFSIPAGWNMAVKSIYACVTYFLMITVAITPASIIGSVLGTMMTSNSKSRQKSSIISSVFVMLGSVAGTVAVQKITEMNGDSPEAWRAVAIGFAVLAFAGQVVQYFFTRERGDPGETEARQPFKASLPALTKNKYFIIMCFVGFLTAIDSAMAGSIMYFFKYVLFNTGLVGVVSAITLVSTVIGIGLVAPIAKKIPPKTLMLAGLAIKIVTLAINITFPGNALLFIALMAVRSFVGSPMMVYGSVFLLNTIEYGEYVTGVRANSLIVTVSSVVTKIGSGVGGALIGWLLDFSGYSGAAAVQTASASNMIVYVYLLIPLAVAAAQFALLKFYKLDKQYDGVTQTLKERKAA